MESKRLSLHAGKSWCTGFNRLVVLLLKCTNILTLGQLGCCQTNEQSQKKKAAAAGADDTQSLNSVASRASTARWGCVRAKDCFAFVVCLRYLEHVIDTEHLTCLELMQMVSEFAGEVSGGILIYSQRTVKTVTLRAEQLE